MAERSTASDRASRKRASSKRGEKFQREHSGRAMKTTLSCPPGDAAIHWDPIPDIVGFAEVEIAGLIAQTEPRRISTAFRYGGPLAAFSSASYVASRPASQRAIG